ncbi:MAG: cupin domain-containing protein [Gemmatimonadales bacterium]
MDIKRAGTQASVVGNADWFTGSVRIDPLFQASAPARAAAVQVTFEPGALPPVEKRWHGASPTTALTHIAVQESLDGGNVDWMEQVTDAQYSAS